MESTTPETEVATGITEEQAASELLKRWAKDEPAEAETEEEAAEPEAEEATPDAEEDTEEEAEESGDIEIDVAGEKFKLPAALKEHAEKIQAKAKEVEAGATRKFQEAAELRKAVESHAELLSRKLQIKEAHTDLVADLKTVQRRLAQYQQLDVARLGQEDPAALTRINAEFNQLKQAEQNIFQALNRAEHDWNETDRKAKEQRLQSLQEFASKNIKGWGGDADVRLNEYLQKKGIDRSTMLELLTKDERLLLVLEDAAYGARVRTATPQKKTDAPKSLKPGSVASTKPSQVAKYEQAMARVKKTGNVNDAAMALLAKSSMRKK